MKYIAYIGMLAIVLLALFSQMSDKVEVVNTSSVGTSTVEILEEVQELDVIEKSKADVERISKELDAEESNLLEQKEQLKAEYEAKQAEIDARLETIVDIRLGF